jgi:hypothetical protein
MTTPMTAPAVRIPAVRSPPNKAPICAPTTHPRIEPAIIEGTQSAGRETRRQRKQDCVKPESVPPVMKTQYGSGIAKRPSACKRPVQIPAVQARHVAAIQAGDNRKLRCRTSHCAVPTMAPQTIQAQRPGSTNTIPMVHASVFATIHQKASLFFIEVETLPEFGNAGRSLTFPHKPSLLWERCECPSQGLTNL